jgi:hypothetical protein
MLMLKVLLAVFGPSVAILALVIGTLELFYV